MSADLLYPLVGGVLLALGAVILGWYARGDRSRGRARCPKCWYGLEGVPDLADGTRTCPECGRAGLTARRMARTRRRTRRAALAILLLISGWGVWKYPAARARGLWSYAPTTVLILVRDLAYTYGWGGSDIGAELLQRVYDGKVNSWQLAKISPWELETLIDTNGGELVWPAGEVLPVELEPPTWFYSRSVPMALCVKARLKDAPTIVQPMKFDDGRFTFVDRVGDFSTVGPDLATRPDPLWYDVGGSWMFDYIFDAGTPPAGATEIVFDWKLMDCSGPRVRTRWSGEYRLPIRVVEPQADEIGLRPVRSPELDAAVREGLVRGFGPDHLGRLAFIVGECGEALNGITLSAVVELKLGEAVIGDVRLIIQPDGHVGTSPDRLRLSPERTSLPADPSDPRWTVRVRPYIPGVVYRGAEHRYWDGDITIPLSELLAR